jgi:hypothetical protein
MSDLQTLLARCQALGITLIPGEGDKLKVRSPSPLSGDLQNELKRRKREILTVLRHEGQTGSRAFLSHPLDCAGDHEGWRCWEPFLTRLKGDAPEQYLAIEDAEKRLSELEAHGITEGLPYETAVAVLFYRFESARRGMWTREMQVWIV